MSRYRLYCSRGFISQLSAHHRTPLCILQEASNPSGSDVDELDGGELTLLFLTTKMDRPAYTTQTHHTASFSLTAPRHHSQPLPFHPALPQHYRG